MKRFCRILPILNALVLGYCSSYPLPFFSFKKKKKDLKSDLLYHPS